MYFVQHPRAPNWAPSASPDRWRHLKVAPARIWPKAVHRVVADGLTPEQAVDEAIARIKQILSE
jgi:hypothetical protein